VAVRPLIPLRHDRAEEVERVGSIELFFDLVFVFAITQLSHLLLQDLTWRGAAQAAFLLLAVWWAWNYTTWTTNWTDPDAVSTRAVLVVGMVAVMLMAVAIPDAFGDRGLLFVAGYAALQITRGTFFLIATDKSGHAHLWRPWPVYVWVSWVTLIWLAGGFLEGEARVAVWGAALAFDYLGPFVGYWTPGLGRSTPADWQILPGHFAERFQLFIIIALGESIVLTGATASGLELTTARIAAIAVAVLITAALWWLYFGPNERLGQAVLSRAGEDRGRIARDVYTYLHLPIVAGIIVVAVADELVIAHPGETLAGRELATVAAGPILYLLGATAAVRRAVGSVSRWRLLAAACIVVVALLGMTVPALLTWALVLLVLTALVGKETHLRLLAGVRTDRLATAGSFPGTGTDEEHGRVSTH
jgi:low temperature requirement protein LtrA